MEAYRYQQLAYLLVPFLVGIEFFSSARTARSGGREAALGSYALDFIGFIFAALIPALFIFTIWASVQPTLPFGENTLARLDRYGVMFLFLGAWWQIYILGALRTRRLLWSRPSTAVILPFLGLGLFASLLVLWVSPFGLKWISVALFVFLSLVIYLLRGRPKVVEWVLWAMAGITFFFMNILFIWLDAVV
jgi:hypothetical protein